MAIRFFGTVEGPCELSGSTQEDWPVISNKEIINSLQVARYQEWVPAWAEEIKMSEQKKYGCANHYCYLTGHGSGMCTNGNCNCLHDIRPAGLRLAVQRRILQLEQQIKSSDKNIKKAIALLEKSKPHIEHANYDAENKHDDCEGEYYMDAVQYEIMRETEAILEEIDNLLTEYCEIESEDKTSGRDDPSDTLWKSVFETKPKNNGWYPVLVCWDSNEGFFPQAAYYSKGSFDTDLPVTNYIDQVFDSQFEAYNFASENDPGW